MKKNQSHPRLLAARVQIEQLTRQITALRQALEVRANAQARARARRARERSQEIVRHSFGSALMPR
jgi:hypothetical protein